MQIVIDIPESIYNDLYANYNLLKSDAEIDWLDAYTILDRIVEGIVLPNGHGRLIDADALRKEILSWTVTDYEPSNFIDEIDMADVIIEADNAESEAEADES